MLSFQKLKLQSPPGIHVTILRLELANGSSPAEASTLRKSIRASNSAEIAAVLKPRRYFAGLSTISQALRPESSFPFLLMKRPGRNYAWVVPHERSTCAQTFSSAEPCKHAGPTDSQGRPARPILTKRDVAIR